MALTDIPALASGYPLFSLSDWPNSQAALVSGGLTSEFEKECWNAIISHLEQALTDAGLEWDSTYTTAAGAKITEEYGDLYAKAVNSLRRNIDILVPLRWGWASDPTFRGYIGRKDFRGVDAYGEDGADDVYPEYIFELVDRLNFLISVLTGESAAIIPGGADLSKTIQAAELLAKATQLLGAAGYALSTGSGWLLSRASAPLYVGEIVRSLYDALLRKGYAAPLGHTWLLRSDYAAAMAKGRAGNLGGHRHGAKAPSSAELRNPFAGSLGGYRDILDSLLWADMDIFNARPVSARLLSASAYKGGAAALPPFPIMGSARSLTHADGAIIPIPGLSIIGSGTSFSGHSATSVRPAPAAVSAHGKSRSVALAGPSIPEASAMSGNELRSLTLAGAVLTLMQYGLDWYDPVQTGSNLYIRSVWYSRQENSTAIIDGEVFYEPVQTGSNLYLRSVDHFWTDGSAGNADTDYFIDPVQTGSNLYIRSDVFGGD